MKYEPTISKATEKQLFNFQKTFLKDAQTLMVDTNGHEPAKDLHAKRSSLRQMAKSILNQAEMDKRDLTASEKDAFDVCSFLLEDIQAAFDNKQDLAGAQKAIMGLNGITAANSVEFWEDKDGRKVPVLSKEHSFADFVGRGNRSNDPNQISAGEFLKAMVLGTNNANSDRASQIKAALSESSDSTGGYTVPDHLLGEFIDVMRAKSHVINAGARTVPLTTEKTTIAKILSDPVPGWRAENGAVAEGDPTFGAITFYAKSLAVLIKVSRELLEDSVNMNEALMQAIGGAMGGEFDRVALFGQGAANEPRGLYNVADINEVLMGDNGAQITNYAKFLSALQTISEANANAPTAAIMAPRTRFAFSGLVDTTGQPLRKPDVLENLPFLETTKVPVDQVQGTSGAVCSSIITGDFTQLYLGVRSAMRIEVLRERFADNLQYAFIAHLRCDMACAQPKAFAALKGIKP